MRVDQTLDDHEDTPAALTTLTFRRQIFYSAFGESENTSLANRTIRSRISMKGDQQRRYVRPTSELWDALDEQLAALTSSAQGYDAGKLWEAKRLAAVVDVLVHDRGRRTVSILTQMEVRDGTRFLASAPPINPRNMLSGTPMVMQHLTTQGMTYLPLLDKGPPFPPRWLPFSKWWEETILKDTNGRSLSRKNLTCSLRDQDGGAHLDGSLTDEAYISISRQNGAGWEFVAPGREPQPVAPGPHLATMRQIAWELEESLATLSRPQST
jgi:hypothetical protein